MRRVDVLKRERIPGKSHHHYEVKKVCEGDFHGWGSNYEEFETGPGNFSTAIVELDDGTVQNVPAELIRFHSTATAPTDADQPTNKPWRRMHKDAMDIIERYGQIEGDHHRAWCLDQVARILQGSYYEVWREGMLEDGYDEGIAP